MCPDYSFESYMKLQVKFFLSTAFLTLGKSLVNKSLRVMENKFDSNLRKVNRGNFITSNKTLVTNALMQCYSLDNKERSKIFPEFDRDVSWLIVVSLTGNDKSNSFFLQIVPRLVNHWLTVYNINRNMD